MTARGPSFALVLALGTALFMACRGGGDDADDLAGIGTNPPSATVAATDGGSGGDGAGADEIEIGETVYHAGYKVLLETASYERGDAGSGVVKIFASFENLGPADNAVFDSRVAIRQGGTDYLETVDFGQDLPALVARGIGRGNFAIRVEDTFRFDDATLFLGHPDNNQAIIPLGQASPDELVTLAPEELPVAGEIVAGAITVDVTSVELRADLPYSYSIEDKNHLSLEINFSITADAGNSIGPGTFLDENVALRTPDGSVLGVRPDGQSGVEELLQGTEGTTISDLTVRFDVPKPAAGEYAFVVTGDYAESGGEATGELGFTVPAESAFGE